MKKDFRYDPLYRVIDEPEELRTLEGRFRKEFDRLKRISNLGVIPRVFEMAKYPKYEHAVGTIHQVNSLLDVVDDEEVIPDEYRKPLLIAAMFIHLGHLPFTYSSERALLLASNLGDRARPNRAKQYVKRRVRKALRAADYDEDKQKAILSKLFSMHDERMLYRFLSAQMLADAWHRVEKGMGELPEGALETVVRDLIDLDCDGYKYLDVADEADFVQRDGLYFGTIQIDVAPEHLYGQISARHPDVSLSEQRLIEYNRRYLAEKFYENREVIAFTRLYEKILAALITSTQFNLKWLEDYDDAQLERLISAGIDSDNGKTRLPKAWVDRAARLFQGDLSYNEILELDRIHFGSEKDAIDVEYELVGKRESQSGLLKYPFDTGILLSVDYDHINAWPQLSDQDLFSVVTFQDQSERRLVELLKLALRLTPYLSVIRHTPALYDGIARQLSWTGEARFDNEAIQGAISEAVGAIEEKQGLGDGEFIRRFLQSLSRIATFGELWDDMDNYIWRALLLDRFQGVPGAVLSAGNRRRHFVQGLLGLPVRLLQYRTTSPHLDAIQQELLTELGSDMPNDAKGDVFEALCLLEALARRRGEYQLILNGVVITNHDGPLKQRDENEFDIIELLINDGGRAECHVYACSIAGNYRQVNKDPLTELADHLHEAFPNLIIQTAYVVPRDRARGDWRPCVKDAGRNYT